MAIKIGYGTGFVNHLGGVNTDVDVTIYDSAGNTFTPTGTCAAVLLYCGRLDSSDAVGSGDGLCGVGLVAGTSQRAVPVTLNDAQTGGGGFYRGMLDTVALRVLATTGADAGSLVIATPFAITNGVRFKISTTFAADLYFSVLVFSDLTNAGLFTITEPAGSAGSAPGPTNHAGAGSYTADFFLIVGSDQADLTIPGTADPAIITIGAACGTAGNYKQMLLTYNGTGLGVAAHYGYDGECAGRMLSTSVRARGAFNGATADGGLNIDWLEIGAAQTRYYCLALDGIEATIQSGLTQTDTSTDITVSGLSGTCLGGLLFSTGFAKNAQDTYATEWMLSMGAFTGTATDRQGAHAIWHKSGAQPTQVATAIRHTDCYANVLNDAIDGAMKLNASLSAGSATLRMTDADSTQRWFGAVLFAEPAAAGRTTKNTRASNLGMELGMNLWMPD